MTSPKSPAGGKGKGKLGKLGKRRGLVVFGAAAAVVAVIAIARRKAAAPGSTAGPTTLRAGTATPYTYGGVPTSFWGNLDALRSLLSKEERQITALQKKQKGRPRRPWLHLNLNGRVVSQGGPGEHLVTGLLGGQSHTLPPGPPAQYSGGGLINARRFRRPRRGG